MASRKRPTEVGDIFWKNGSQTFLVVMEIDAAVGQAVMLPLDGARIAIEKPPRRVPLAQLLMSSRYVSQGNVEKFGEAAYVPPPPPRPVRKRDDYRHITYWLHPGTAFHGGRPSPDVLAAAVQAISTGIAAAFPTADVRVEVVESEGSAGFGFDRIPRSLRRGERDSETIREIAARAITSAQTGTAKT